MSPRAFFRSEKSKHIYFEKLENKNAETAIIFLHGLLGSKRFWGKPYKELSKKHTLYLIDLLGFGSSAKPRLNYTNKVHIQALRKFIKEQVKEKHIILVGYSLGSIIALGYLAKYPEEIEKIILLALPYYSSSEEAISIAKAYSKPQFFVIDSLLLNIFCTLWCFYSGPVSRRIMPYLMKRTPKEIAHDSLMHTYNSYITTLYNVIYHQDFTPLLTRNMYRKIFLIQGENDEVAPLKNIKELSKKYNLPLHIIKGSHNFPVESNEQTKELLDRIIN